MAVCEFGAFTADLHALAKTLTTVVVMVLAYTSKVQGQPFRTTVQMQNVLERLESNTDRFCRSVDAALEHSRLNNTDLQDQANALVDELESAN